MYWSAIARLWSLRGERLLCATVRPFRWVCGSSVGILMGPGRRYILTDYEHNSQQSVLCVCRVRELSGCNEAGRFLSVACL